MESYFFSHDQIQLFQHYSYAQFNGSKRTLPNWATPTHLLPACRSVPPPAAHTAHTRSPGPGVVRAASRQLLCADLWWSCRRGQWGQKGQRSQSNRNRTNPKKKDFAAEEGSDDMRPTMLAPRSLRKASVPPALLSDPTPGSLQPTRLAVHVRTHASGRPCFASQARAPPKP
jgi:hypothetical protein